MPLFCHQSHGDNSSGPFNLQFVVTFYHCFGDFFPVCATHFSSSAIWYATVIKLMMMSSNGKTFSALLAFCAGIHRSGEFTAQRPVTRSFDVYFDLRPNTRSSKQWWGWWFETPSCPLWRHCNVRGHWQSFHMFVTRWLLHWELRQRVHLTIS